MSTELNGDLHVTRREPVHAGFRYPLSNRSESWDTSFFAPFATLEKLSN